MQNELKKRLTTEASRLVKLLTFARGERDRHKRYVLKGVACIRPTFYGDVQEEMAANANRRYHYARWVLAVEAVERRLRRVRWLLREKSTSQTEEAPGGVKITFVTKKIQHTAHPSPWNFGVTTTTT